MMGQRMCFGVEYCIKLTTQLPFDVLRIIVHGKLGGYYVFFAEVIGKILSNIGV